MNFIAAIEPVTPVTQSQSGGAPGVPSVAIPKTTAVLVILTPKPGVTPQQIMAVIPEEICLVLGLHVDQEDDALAIAARIPLADFERRLGLADVPGRAAGVRAAKVFAVVGQDVLPEKISLSRDFRSDLLDGHFYISKVLPG